MTHDEKSAAGRKFKKEHLILMPRTNSSGSHNLKLLVLGKYKNLRPFKNIKKKTYQLFQIGVWVSRELKWYKQDFVPAEKLFLMLNEMPVKALLLLYNAPGHPIDAR